MNATTQQIRPGLLFTRKIGRSVYTYRVLDRDLRSEYWSVKVIALDGREVVGGAHPLSGREIQDAMSKGE